MADPVKLKDFRRKLMDGSFMSDPKFKAPATGEAVHGAILDDGGTYGVSRDHDEIVLSLGLAPPFRVPVQSAIKLALLILRRSGVEVDLGQE